MSQIVVQYTTIGRIVLVDVFLLPLIVVWKVMITQHVLSVYRIKIYMMEYVVSIMKIIHKVLVLVLQLLDILMIVLHNITNKMMYVVRKVSIMINMK